MVDEGISTAFISAAFSLYKHTLKTFYCHEFIPSFLLLG